ncbi:hypothetical protein BDD12DRAFT_805648 [Trichophaea hybrida]|nr:hypothetical protein BDD12DRAFT_805648 [Trichophaea hybrida]
MQGICESSYSAGLLVTPRTDILRELTRTDALDEFDDRNDFLSVITRLIQETGKAVNLKIFVSSRREHDIETHFNLCNVPAISIDARKVDADIDAFVHHEVGRWGEKATEFIVDKPLMDEITHALTSRSNGMFLWVKFQLDYIYEQPSISDVKAALNSLPDTMDETFLRILKKIDAQIPARKQIAKRALMWAVGAARPLTLQELVLAVPCKPGCRAVKELEIYSEQTILQACKNLITVEDNTVRLVHFSAYNFLTRRREPIQIDKTGLLQRYQAAINDKHANLAETCIQYLIFEESQHGGSDTLHSAARGGSVLAIQSLLKMGHSVHTRDFSNRLPLDQAAEMGHLEALDLLLQKGADANARGGPFGNAFHAAA